MYEPPRYMTVTQCIEQLLEIEDKRKENGEQRASAGMPAARGRGQCVRRVCSSFLRRIWLTVPLVRRACACVCVPR